MTRDNRIDADEVAPSIWVVTARGEHDVSTVGHLDETLTWIAETSGTTVVLDLSAATFIESTFVGAMIQHARGHPEEGGDWLVVVAPPETAPRRVLDLVEGHRLVRLFDTRDDALWFARERE